LKVKLKQDKEARSERQTKQQEELLNAVKNSIARSLCDYGAGLRTLPEDERISVILSGAAEKRQSVIMVFDKKRVMQCVSGKLKSENLLEKAESYTF